MTEEFEKYIKSILEKSNKPSPNEDDGEDVSEVDDDEGMMDDMDIPDDDNMDEAKTYPEEIELAKLAVRAIYFDINSKNVHDLGMWVTTVNPNTHEKRKERIPFEKVADYFEKTKNYRSVLGFVEHVMDHYEGLSSKWTEPSDIEGKGILSKLRYFNNLPETEKLDNGKRVHWARIVLNCLLNGQPGYNLNIDDVNAKNIKDIFKKLNQDFGGSTRGIFSTNIDLKGVGT